MQVVIVFKSVTYAQKAERLLMRRGITGNIIKAPFGAKAGSCAYGIKVNEKYLTQACRIIKEAHLPVIDVMSKGDDGIYRGMGV